MKRILVVVLLLVFGIVALVHAQEAKEAVITLKKFTILKTGNWPNNPGVSYDTFKPSIYITSSPSSSVTGNLAATLSNLSGFISGQGVAGTMVGALSQVTGTISGTSGSTGTANMVLDGNSFTYGQGANHPYYYYWTVNCTPTIHDISVGGQETSAMITRGTTAVDPLFNARFAPNNLVIQWDSILADLIHNDDAQGAYNRIVQYYKARRAAGWKVVAITCMPTSHPHAPADYEACRQRVNAQIRANWQNYADALADPGNDPIIGQPSAVNDATYYQQDERTHLTDAGLQIAATYIGAAVNSILSPNSTVTGRMARILPRPAARFQ